MGKKIWSNPDLWQLNVEDTEFSEDKMKSIDEPNIEIKNENYDEGYR